MKHRVYASETKLQFLFPAYRYRVAIVIYIYWIVHKTWLIHDLCRWTFFASS